MEGSSTIPRNYFSIIDYDSNEPLKTTTKAVAAGCAITFLCFSLVACFILVRFLIVQNKCKRRPMVLFYCFSLLFLLLKTSRFALTIRYGICSDVTQYLTFFSLNAFLVVGIIHSYNLMKLISDLRTIDAQERQDYKAMRWAYVVRKLITGLWTLVVVAILTFLCLDKLEIVVFIDTIVYSIIALKLLYLNFSLLKTIRHMFGNNYAENNFKQERRFLIVTVFFFSMAYFLLALQSLIGTLFIYIDGEKYMKIVCSQSTENLVFTLINVLVVDLIPFAAIFTLHWINFRKETAK